MKTFKQTAAQGDVYFEKIDELPKGVVRVQPEGDHVIVAHSETGHHHVMDRATTAMYRLPESIYDCFLVVNKPTALTHLRDHHTHEPILFQPGTYRVTRQREASLAERKKERFVAD